MYIFVCQVTLSNHAHCPAHDPTTQQHIFSALHMTPHYVRSKDLCSAHLQANTRSLITRLSFHSHSHSPQHADTLKLKRFRP